MSVGERIAQLRKEQNMSQGRLAEAVGVSRQAVSKWENGLSVPDSVNLILLAQILSTDIEYLTTGRINDAIRPPVVITAVEKVESVVEVPVVQIKERVVEVPVVEYVEKPIIRKVIHYRYRRNYIEYVMIGVLCFALGLLIGCYI